MDDDAKRAIALMLAQRYPRDFNGIIAGAPASNLAPLALLNAWLVASNTGPGGRQVLTADSGQTLGVAWATPGAGAAGALTLLSTTTLSSNGTFDISSISGSYLRFV